MLFTFLILLPTCAIFFIFAIIINERLHNRILTSSNYAERVKIRKAYKLFKVLLLIGFCVLIFIEDQYFFKSIRENMSHDGWRYKQITYIIICASITIFPIANPVNTLTIDKFKKKKFILFLRGFSSDDYASPKIEAFQKMINLLYNEKSAQNDRASFSEFDFATATNRLHLPAYSVGMTKELYSPNGTKRIYLDDETWKDNVSLLINKAKYVFILVNASDSCIWEILQCQNNAINKTAFIIDDEKKLEELQNKLKYNTPKCLSEHIKKFSIVYMHNGKCKTCKYQNNVDELFSVLKEFTHDKDTENYNQTVTFTLSNESLEISNKRLGIDNLNLTNSDDFETANSRISSSNLTEKQKNALQMQVFLVHFRKNSKIDWNAIPGLSDNEIEQQLKKF